MPVVEVLDAPVASTARAAPVVPYAARPAAPQMVIVERVIERIREPAPLEREKVPPWLRLLALIVCIAATVYVVLIVLSFMHMGPMGMPWEPAAQHTR